jgi:quercetin dioxygenase-like cupin family protein
MVDDKSPTTQGAAARATFVRALPDAKDGGRLLAPPESVVMRSGLVVLQPGANCGWHSTDEYEEMLICLEGSGEVHSEGQAPLPMTAGRYAYNPPRTRHNVFNTGKGPLRYIFVVSKAVATGEG